MKMISCGFVLTLVNLAILSGCASEGLSKMKEGALQVVGITSAAEQAAKSAAARESAKPVSVNIYAGRNLNSDSHGRGMATVFRIYRLRDPAAFMQATYEQLADAQGEKSLLGADLVDVKEWVVKPGEEVLRTETLGGEAAYLGVVALYRKPAPDRWRLSFARSNPANDKGIVIGAHACAMTVSRGEPFQAQLVNAGSLGGVLCR